jgi:hypothetical protein
MVGRIRKVLGLQAKSVAMVVNLATFARNGSIEKVPAVELNSWFSTENLQNATALWLVSLSD